MISLDIYRCNTLHFKRDNGLQVATKRLGLVEKFSMLNENWSTFILFLADWFSI